MCNEDTNMEVEEITNDKAGKSVALVRTKQKAEIERED